MDLRNELIESGTHHKRGGWKATLASLGVHGAIIGLIVFIGTQATQKVAAENKPMRTFLLSKAAPPPPPLPSGDRFGPSVFIALPLSFDASVSRSRSEQVRRDGPEVDRRTSV